MRSPCPLCKAVDPLGVGQPLRDRVGKRHQDSIAAIVIVSTRCGYLMPLAADRVTQQTRKAA